VATLFLVAVTLCTPAAAATTYVEDFEDDVLGNMVAGYDTAVFSHLFAGTNFALTDDTFSPAVPPSLHHQLFMGADTTDAVTFTLPAGSVVTYAGVWMTGTGGGRASVEFIDSNLQVLRFESLLQDSYQLFDTTGSLLGNIVGIRLNSPPPPPFSPGMEALYDDLTITVIPEPSTGALAALALVGLAAFARRRRHFRA
jgi:MYXO-CTERM domain-containing protein